MEETHIFNFFKQKEIFIQQINKEGSEKIIKKMISIVNGDNLHYLWSNYNSDAFITQKKISCKQDIYIETLKKVIIFNDIDLIIDKVCFSDYNDNFVMKLSKSELLELLNEFYWELDEIYIFNSNQDFFISLNHNFELSLYGDNKSDLCNKTLERIEALN